MGRPKRKKNASKSKFPNVSPNIMRNVNMKRSNIVKPLTKRNVIMRKNKNAEPNTRKNVPRNKNVTRPTRKNVQRNKNAKLPTPKSVSPLTIMKRNVRKFLMSNVTMSTNVTRCPNKNATMLMYPNVKMYLNNIVLITLCLIAKKYPNKNVTRNTKINVITKKNMFLTKKRKHDASGLLTELALMTPNVNFTKFFSNDEEQASSKSAFFSSEIFLSKTFDDDPQF